MAQILNRISTFEKAVQDIETTNVIEFLRLIIKNLDSLSNDFGDVKYREDISNLKIYLEKLIPLIKVILRRAENNISQKEMYNFKKLLMKKVEKVAFRNILG